MKNFLPEKGSGRDNFVFETHYKSLGYVRVAGCDEVGRGPLAGPVVAAAVILPSTLDPTLFDDSKKLSHKKRLSLHQLLCDSDAEIGIGIVSEKEIDRINILQASLRAMKMASDKLHHGPPDFILVDGKFTIPNTIPQHTLIKGESKSGSIAAASIVAKVTRDQLMEEMHALFPLYNFAKNKGYPTKEHRQALAKFGPCSIHRTTFKGVQQHA